MKIDYSYVRAKKAEFGKDRHDRGLEKKTDLLVEKYSNATVLPLRKIRNEALLFGRGGALDCDNNYIELSGIQARIMGSYSYEKVEKIDANVVYCGYLIRHWGHFLVEAVTRLWYFLENDSDEIDYYVFFVEENVDVELYGNYKAFMDLLGISHKLLIINKPIQFSTVIIPERAYVMAQYYSEQYKKIFDKIGDEAEKKYHFVESEKIYISRGHFSKAKNYEIGLEVLENYYTKNKYDIVYPEELNLGELAVKLRSAKLCSVCSGSTALNLLFAKDKMNVVVLERIPVMIMEEIDIDIIKDFNTTFVDANLALYPVSVGSGPCFYAYTNSLKKYTHDNNYLPPDDKYLDDKYLLKGLRKYMKIYKKEYQFMWGLSGKWQLRHIGETYEAFEEALGIFRDYLSGRKALFLSQYFSKHGVKLLVKKMLGK